METVIRVAVIYLALMIGFRVLGKRELSQLSSFELVTLMLIPEIVSNSLNRDDHSVTEGLLGAFTLFGLVFLTSAFSHFVKPAQKVIEGQPTLLLKDGKFQEDVMNRERVSESEILAEAHRVGLEEIAQIRWAVLEADGTISIIPKRGAWVQPPPHDSQLQ